MSSLLYHLPREVLALVTDFLPNSDIKNLRLTSRHLGDAARLHLTRVFLSPNPLNIQVFLAIAHHDVYRRGVTELVYDDTRLFPSRVAYERWLDLPRAERHGLVASAFLDWTWFCEERHAVLDHLKSRLQEPDLYPPRTARRRRFKDAARAHLAAEKKYRNVRASERANVDWHYYQKLVAEQEAVLASGADIDALREGLRCFPQLRKVTVTPIAHGTPFSPFYETPMIRAFPAGFCYPWLTGWPGEVHYDLPAQAPPWDTPPWRDSTIPACLALWRGFCAVTKTLAENSGQNQITELVIDGHPLRTGLNVSVFAQRCPEYDSLTALLAAPCFRALDLSLTLCDGDGSNWAALSGGLLRAALKKAAPNLESLSFTTDCGHYVVEAGGVPPRSLRTIFPKFTQLRDFRLWKLTVTTKDLIAFLNDMPRTLRRAELGELGLHHVDESYHGLLEAMKETLTWKTWERRPRLSIGTSEARARFDLGVVHLMETEVDEFLYNGGENPFCGGEIIWDEDPRWEALCDESRRLPLGILRDVCDPDYEEPYAPYAEYDMDGNLELGEYLRKETPRQRKERKLQSAKTPGSKKRSRRERFRASRAYNYRRKTR